MANKSFNPSEFAATAAWLKVVQQHVGDMRFGTVQLTVHDGRVVQVERTERIRLALTATEEQPKI